MARWTGAFGVNATHVNARALDAVAAAYYATPGLRVQFYDAAPIERARDRAWSATSTYARETVASDELLDNQLIRDNAFYLLVAALLATFPNNTLDLREARDGSTAVPASLNRAISYMEEHIGESIGLDDLAFAARLSPRGLESAFVRILGMSPMRYLRRLRLEAVRDELLRADPTAGDTVTAVAQRWGFARVARFSYQYAAEFGEHPGETLRR